MTVFEGFQLILNCDFIAVADRKYCQVFYGRERLLGEDVAAYSFLDDGSFEKALKTATVLSGIPAFEKLWSAKQFEDRPGGYICLKRKRGDSLLYHLRQAKRTQQFKYCMKLVEGLLKIHEQGRPHGGLDEDNVIFDERLSGPCILEVLSGFYPNQLDPSLCAPEQIHETSASFATDVYWVGNLYLSTIRRPSHKLRQLIRRCRAENPENRPRMADVAKTLREVYNQDLEITLRRWFIRPQWSMKLAGIGLLASAAVIYSFDYGLFQPADKAPSFETVFKEELNQAALQPSKIPDISEILNKADSEQKVKIAIDALVNEAAHNRLLAEPIKEILKGRYTIDPVIKNREQLVSGLSEINLSLQALGDQETGVVDTFEENFVGVMIFDWPILITTDGVWELGDWVIFDGMEGFISRIALNHVVMKNGREVHRIEIDTAPMLTKLNWQEKNIYIPGQKPNMHSVVNAFKKLDYDIIEIGAGGAPGYISGYFSFPNPEEFLSVLQDNLSISISGKTIWIEDVQKFRTYIPLELYFLDEPSCVDVFRNLLQFSGIDFSVDPACEIPLSFYTYKAELKEVIQLMGYQWHLSTESSNLGVTFFRKE